MMERKAMEPSLYLTHGLNDCCYRQSLTCRYRGLERLGGLATIHWKKLKMAKSRPDGRNSEDINSGYHEEDAAVEAAEEIECK
jgi:hypothetical protein